jgi:hypothetical protein
MPAVTTDRRVAQLHQEPEAVRLSLGGANSYESGLLREPTQSAPPTPREEAFGKAVCCLPYAGAMKPDTMFAPLLNGALGERLTGRIVGSAKTGGLLLPMRSGAVVVTQVATPMKMSAFSDDMAQRAIWPDWQQDAVSWRSHVIVSAFGEAKSLHLARACAGDVTTVAAILAGQSGAGGAYWAASGLVFPVQTFLRSVERSPLPVEVLFRCVSRAGAGLASARTGVTTRGLHLFSLPEIDQPPTGDSLVILSERLLSAAAQLLNVGHIPENGELFMLPGGAEVRIRHAWDADANLVLVLMPPAG